MDRSKPGAKRNIVTRRGGPPLALILSGANCHHSKALIKAFGAILPSRQPSGPSCL